MSAKLEEITAVFLREQVRRDLWTVGIVRGTNGGPAQFSVVGDSEPDEFKQGLTYRFFGGWDRTNEKYGPQFKFRTFVRALPHGRAGVVRYLQECRHIGPTTAGKLWEKFQADAVRILRESPEVAAAAVSRLTVENAAEASEDLRRMQAIEGATVDLMDLIDGRGFPKSMVRDAIRMWGNEAAERLKRSPYLAMAFAGIGFKKADAFYLDLGHPPARLKRQAMCLAHAVETIGGQQGHVWVGLEQAAESLRASIGGADVKPAKAIKLATRGKLLRLRTDAAGQHWLAEERKAAAEESVCRMIVTAFDESRTAAPAWPSLDRPEFESLTEHQRAGLAAAIGGGPIGILGGSPGTGKTYTTARLISALIAMHGAESIAVMTPTGKATVRCREALVANGVTAIVPKTTHRTLGVASAEGGWSFTHKEGNPLPFKFLIVDEFSMVGTGLLRSLLAARGRGTAVLFVGDVEQLPPVEYGAPLRDFIAAGLPCGTLKEIHRNAGTIVRACAAIRDGKPFEVDEVADLKSTPPKNLVLIQAGKSAAPAKVLAMLKTIRDESPFNPTWDVMTLVAVNKRSALSRRELNPRIQAELNPSGERVEGSPFRAGDKLIQLENQFLKLDGRGDGDGDAAKVLCCNGEFARAVEVHAKKTVVEFDGAGVDGKQRRCVVPRGIAREGGTDAANDDDTDTGCKMDLGYAITVHKAQGSGCPVVIVCLDEYPGASGQFGVCDRSWLYTAISRAEKLCVLVGTMETARAICGRRFIWRRKTFAVELLREFAAQVGVVFESKLEADLW